MITIKKVDLEDLESLQKISIRTFSDTFGKDNHSDNMNQYVRNAYSKKKLSRELKNEQSEFYFIILENQLAGYLKLNFGDAQTEKISSTGLEIERIYVDSACKRKGLGKNLYEFAIQRAKKLKKDTVWLGVWEKNISAIEFYKKMGFVFISQHSFFLGEDEQTDLIMKKEIN